VSDLPSENVTIRNFSTAVAESLDLPAEPQQKGAEAHQRSGVPAEAIARFAVVVEAAAARPDDHGANEA
jgi:hypothetical protein